MNWLGRDYLGYSLQTHLTAVGVFLLFLGGFKLGRAVVVDRLRAIVSRTANKVDDLVIELLDMIRTPEQYLLAFYLATRPYVLPPWLHRGFRAAVVVTLTYRAVTMLQRALVFALTAATDEAKDPAAIHTRRTMTLIVNAAVWVLAALFVLSNLGFNISSMIAGLGIGGIAVALAAQAVLGDLFSAVAIWLDRPFELGDFIVFDGFMGTVEEIGIKTTRVRALSGEMLIVPNASLTSARIRNFKRMHERRVAMPIGVDYKTPVDTLARLPAIVEALVRKDERLRFERVHVDRLGESSIDLELVYWVLSADFAIHMAAKQELLLAVLKAFAKEGVEIPFPRRTVVLRQES